MALNRGEPPSAAAAGAGGSSAHLQGLARGGILNLIGSLSSGLIGFGLVLVVTRGLGADEAGALLEAVAVFTILYFTATLGTEQGLVRFVSQASVLGRRNELPRVIWAALVPVVVVGVGLGVLVYLLAEPLAVLLASSGDELELERALRVVSPAIVFGALTVATLAITRGFSVFTPTVAIDRVGRPLAQLTLLVVAVSLTTSATIVTAAWIGPFGLALVPAAIAAYVLTSRRLSDPRRTGAAIADEARSTRVVTTEFWRFTSPNAVATFLQVSVRWLDTLLVGALQGTRDAAIYTAATRLLLVGQFVNQAIIQATAPPVSEALAADDTDRAASIYETATSWLLLAVWPFYLTTAVFAGVVLEIFGSDFVAGATAMSILSAAMLIATGSGPVEIVLLMSGRSGRSLVNNAISLGSNIVLNLLLIPRYGLVGAAVAWFVSLSLTNLIPLFQVRRHVGIHPFGTAFLRAGAAALGCYAIPALVVRFAVDPGAVGVVIYLAVATIVYLAVLLRMRRSLQLNVLIDVLRRRATGKGEAPDIGAPDASAGRKSDDDVSDRV